jgi:hypothetical protein
VHLSWDAAASKWRAEPHHGGKEERPDLAETSAPAGSEPAGREAEAEGGGGSWSQA